jgi:hypothetical protein
MSKKRIQIRKSKQTAKRPVKRAGKRVRRITQIDALDTILLRMASEPYDRILKQIEVGKKRINDERRLALQLGQRILAKARKVRDSIISQPKARG